MSPACTGPCAKGHYCPVGSTSSTAFPCPSGEYPPLLDGHAAAADCCSYAGLLLTSLQGGTGRRRAWEARRARGPASIPWTAP